MLLAVLAFLQAVPTPGAPRREIADPGAIATDQRVTPAGVQSVFTDRVFGVRFGELKQQGKTADETVTILIPELSAMLPGAANRLDAAIRSAYREE